MKLTFSPMRHEEPLTLSRSGDALTINGEVFDFAPLPDGGELPLSAIDSDWFAGPVRREGGALALTLVLPHGPDAPQETLFPAPLDVTEDGPVALPAYETPVDAEVPHDEA